MTRYVVRRLLQIPLTLLLVSIIVFSIVHLSPGDPVQLMLGDFASQEDIAELRSELGFDQPLYRQYFEWLLGLLQFDLGTSLLSGRPVSAMVLERAPYTMMLAMSATLLSMLIAPVLGITGAKFYNKLPDQVLMVFSMLGMAMPSFVVSILLILVFAVQFGLLPIAGPGDPANDPLGSIKYYILPVTSLSILRTAQFTRVVRASMLDVLQRDYIRVARAKGISERHVVVRHALKNSLIPVITIVALSFATTLGGTVVTESIFSIPGLGTLMLEAIVARDFPVIQGTTLVVALIFISVNIIADLLYAFVDPRIKYQ